MSKCVYVPIYNRMSSSMGDTGLPLMATNLDDIGLFYMMKSENTVDAKNVPVVTIEELSDRFIRGRNNYIIKKELPEGEHADALIKKIEDFWDDFGEQLKQQMIKKMQDQLTELSAGRKSAKKTVKKTTKRVSRKPRVDEDDYDPEQDETCGDVDEYDGFDKSLHQHYLDEEACDEPKRSRRKTAAKKASKKSCGDELPEIDLTEIHLSSEG